MRMRFSPFAACPARRMVGARAREGSADMLTLSENFRALFYAPFYAAFAIGAYQAEGVAVTLRPSPDPASTAADLLAGRVDAMWGGPLRVLLTHAADPAADTVCFCDVVARDPFFIVGREPRADFRLADLVGLRFASVAEVPTPWLCLQDDLRRAGIDPGALNRDQRPEHGGECRCAACRHAGCGAVVPALRRRIGDGGRRPYLVRGGDARPDRLHHAGRPPLRAGRAARRIRRHGARHASGRCVGWRRRPARTWRSRLAGFFPDVPPPIFAAAIERYRALGLYAPDPVLRREGFDRLQAAMLSGGVLQNTIAFETCVDNTLAKRAIAPVA